MKKFFIILIIIIILIILLGIGAFIFIKNFNINDYQGQVVSQISKALDRKVKLEEITMKLSLGDEDSHIKIEDLLINAKDDDFFKDSMLIKEVLMDFDFSAFVKTKEIKVKKIHLHIEEVLLEIESQEDELPVRNLDVLIEDFEFKRPFSLRMTAGILSKDENIKIDSIIVVDQEKKSLQSEEVKIIFNLGLINIDLIKQIFKDFPQAEISGPIEGEIYTVIRDVYIEKETASFIVNSRLKDGFFKLTQIGVPLEQIDVSLKADSSKINFDHFKFDFAGGKVAADLESLDYLRTNELKFQILAENLKLSELLINQDMPLDVKGLLSAQIKGKADGLDSDVLTKSLNADGQVNILSGKVVDFNLLNFVLKKISKVFDVNKNIDLYLTDKYKKVLENKDTEIKIFKLTPKIENGFIYFNNSIIQVDGFNLMINARLDFKQNLNLDGSLLIEEDLTKILIESDDSLEYFVDDKQIRIPLSDYRGKIDNVRIYPDVVSLSKQILRTKGKDELRKAIFKALDIEQDKKKITVQGSFNATQPAPAQPVKTDKKPEEILIENILDSIPIFK